MNTASQQDDADLEPVGMKVRADTTITTFLDEAARVACGELPAQPRPVMLAASQAGTKQVVPMLIGKLRDMRVAVDARLPRRPGHAPSAALASEIAAATDVVGAAEENS